MYPILLSIGKFKLYSFGSFIALGAIAAGLFLYRNARIRRLPTAPLFDLVLYTLLAGLVGARIGYYFLYQEQFQSFWQIFYFWQGGLIALTGLLAGYCVYVFTIKKEQLPTWPMLDIGLLALLVGWGIGKIGCHLSACTIGRTGQFLTINGTYPVDLYSSIWALLLAVVLSVMWLQQKLREGIIFFLALEGFFLGEFLIKMLKADFGEGTARLEAVIYLILIVITYAFFWRLHGPNLGAHKIGASVRNFVSRRRNV